MLGYLMLSVVGLCRERFFAHVALEFPYGVLSGFVIVPDKKSFHFEFLFIRDFGIE